MNQCGCGTFKLVCYASLNLVLCKMLLLLHIVADMYSFSVSFLLALYSTYDCILKIVMFSATEIKAIGKYFVL